MMALNKLTEAGYSSHFKRETSLSIHALINRFDTAIYVREQN